MSLRDALDSIEPHFEEGGRVAILEQQLTQLAERLDENFVIDQEQNVAIAHNKDGVATVTSRLDSLKESRDALVALLEAEQEAEAAKQPAPLAADIVPTVHKKAGMLDDVAFFGLIGAALLGLYWIWQNVAIGYGKARAYIQKRKQPVS